MTTQVDAFLAVLRNDKDDLWQPWSRPFDHLRDEAAQLAPPMPPRLKPFSKYRIRLFVTQPKYVEVVPENDVLNVIGVVVDGRTRSEALIQSLIDLCAKLRKSQDGFFRSVGFHIILVRQKGDDREEALFTDYQLRILDEVALALGQQPSLTPVDHDDETFLQVVANLPWQLALRIRQGS